MPGLFDPIQIGPMEIKNRFVRSSTHEAMADEKGYPGPGLFKCYEKLARGEVGLIITGMAFVSQEGRSTAKGMLGIHHDGLIPAYRKLVSHVHDHGAKIAMQITHAGRQTRKEATGVRPMAPSPVYDRALLSRPREMTEEDIQRAIDSYAQACSRVRESGFDAVQIQLGHGYLPNQFQSPFLNRRRDHWGGSPENRMRFIKELYVRCRHVVGTDYPILAKVNVQDNLKKGQKPEEGIPMASSMAGMGFDSLEVSGGIYADGFSMMRGELPMDVFLEWDLYRNHMNRVARFFMRRYGNRMFGVLPSERPSGFRAGGRGRHAPGGHQALCAHVLPGGGCPSFRLDEPDPPGVVRGLKGYLSIRFLRSWTQSSSCGSTAFPARRLASRPAESTCTFPARRQGQSQTEARPAAASRDRGSHEAPGPNP